MNQHASLAIEALLYESIASGEVLEKIFVVDVIDFDDSVLVRGEESLIQG